MSFVSLTLLGLLTAQSFGLATLPKLLVQRDDSAVASASQISVELSAPTFKPYARPVEKVTEFIALGDSYTAGTGSNGLNEVIAADAIRGNRAYPMQIFHAYTGDTSVELVTEQLKQGDYRDDKNLPRAQPFGKPQLAVLTIGGNDARLSSILNDCVYKGWNYNDCEPTLAALQADIDSGLLRDKINVALYNVAHVGRQAGGANPAENFQVYVLAYVTFFNEQDTACNDITMCPWWRATEPKLTTDLRKRLNGFTDAVNGEIKKAATDLERMGVIFVDGDLGTAYNGHRYCEPGHTDKKMIDAATWFWSSESHTQTTSEGPGDNTTPYPASGVDEIDNGQAIIDFVFPGQGLKASQVTDASPPWTWPGAEKYPTFEDLMAAMTNASGPGTQSDLIGFPFTRSFHPKGTAYGVHATALFSAIADNRGTVSINADQGILTCGTRTDQGDEAHWFTLGQANDAAFTLCLALLGAKPDFKQGSTAPPVTGTVTPNGRKGALRFKASWNVGHDAGCPAVDWKSNAGNDAFQMCKDRIGTTVNLCDTNANGKMDWKQGGTFYRDCITWEFGAV